MEAPGLPGDKNMQSTSTSEEGELEVGSSKLDPYRLYIQRTTRNDKIFVKECNESMDTVMVFAGLFSAAITQFIASTYSLLQPDAQGQSNALLVTLITVTKNPSTTDITHVTDSPDFRPSAEAVAINSLFFFSLILSLLAALGAMLTKQMARRYETHGADQSLPWKRARLRERKRIAIVAWHVEDVIAFIPMLLHVALVLFLMGVLIWTSLLSRGSMIPSVILVSLAGILYLFLAVAPLESEDAPFQWPASSGVKSLFNGIRWLSFRARIWAGKCIHLSTRSGSSSPKEPSSEADVEKGPGYVPDLFLPAGQLQQTPGAAPPLGEPTASAPVENNGAPSNSSPIIPVSATSPIDKGKHEPTTSTSANKSATILPAIDTSSINFIPTPSEPVQPDMEQLYPQSYELLDSLVLVNLIRETEVYCELESIFQTLRTVDWGQLKVGNILAAHGEIILHRCASLAATTWYQLGGKPAIRAGMRTRARHMCLFIEWFYYQLTVEQRRSLTNWPRPAFAEGLARYLRGGGDFPTVPLDDLLVASSVLAKLHHVQLAEDEICDRCIIEETRDTHDIRSRLRRDDFYYPDGTFDSSHAKEAMIMQAKVSACVSSDTDCLVHYVRKVPDELLRRRIRASVDILSVPIDLYLGCLNERFTYEDCRNFLKALETTIPKDDPRLLWFSELDKELNIEAAVEAQKLNGRLVERERWLRERNAI